MTFRIADDPGTFVSLIESLRVHSPRLAACAVIPADAGIQKPDWMPDQVRHDVQYPAACGGVVYFQLRRIYYIRFNTRTVTIVEAGASMLDVAL